MRVAEFLAALDAVRVDLRSRHKKMDAQLPVADAALDTLTRLVDRAASTLVQAQVLDDLFAIAPDEPAPTPENAVAAQQEINKREDRVIKCIVDRGEGEGRMIIMANETPFKPRKPILEEVTEEELDK